MRDISIFIFAMQFCKNPYFESKRIIDPFSNAPLFFFFYIELTTCFHEFSECKSTNFFLPIITGFFFQILKTEKQKAFGSVRKISIQYKWQLVTEFISFNFLEMNGLLQNFTDAKRNLTNSCCDFPILRHLIKKKVDKKT